MNTIMYLLILLLSVAALIGSLTVKYSKTHSQAA